MKFVAVIFSVLLLVVVVAPVAAQEQQRDPVTVIKTDGLTTVSPGQQITYTITITNNIDSDLSADISDTLPSQVSNIDSTDLVGSSTTAGTVNWTDVTIPSGDFESPSAAQR